MTDPSQWSPQAKLAGVGIVILVLAGGWIVFASHSAECPRLEKQYTDNWLQYGSGMAEDTRRRAMDKGCRWALVPKNDIMKKGQY